MHVAPNPQAALVAETNLTDVRRTRTLPALRGVDVTIPAVAAVIAEPFGARAPLSAVIGIPTPWLMSIAVQTIAAIIAEPPRPSA